MAHDEMCAPHFTGRPEGFQRRADPCVQQARRCPAEHGVLQTGEGVLQHHPHGRLTGGPQHGRRRAQRGEYPQNRLPQRQGTAVTRDHGSGNVLQP